MSVGTGSPRFSGNAESAVGSGPRRLIAEMQPMQRRMLVELNPLPGDAEILFVKRYTYNSKHYYDDFQHISRWGGNLCVLSPADGQVREVAPELCGGIFDRYDLSFDAGRVTMPSKAKYSWISSSAPIIKSLSTPIFLQLQYYCRSVRIQQFLSSEFEAVFFFRDAIRPTTRDT